jgi:hypothetical protein
MYNLISYCHHSFSHLFIHSSVALEPFVEPAPGLIFSSALFLKQIVGILGQMVRSRKTAT